MDLPFTFLEAAGIEVPVGYQGVGQKESWKDAGKCDREWAMVEFRPTQSPFMQKTFIKDKYKLVVYHDREYGELYDLEVDPEQLKNLWDDREYQDIKSTLMYKMISAEMEKDGKLRERPVPA